MKKLITLVSMFPLFIGWNNTANAQWSTIAKPVEHYPAVYLTTHNNTMYCITNNGFYKFNNDAWDDPSQGSANVSGSEIVFIDNYIYLRGANNRSSDGGATWEFDTVGLPPFGEKNSLFSDGTHIYLSYGYPSYQLFRKKPSDNSWVNLTDIGSNTSIVWGLTKKGNDLFAAVSNGCWISSDGGQTWSKKTSTDFPLTNAPWKLQGAGNSFIVHNSELYFGADVGLFKSSDNGDSWVRVDKNFQESFGAVTIQAVYSDGTNLYASTRNSNNAYMSSDHGDTWTEISGGLDSKINAFTSLNGTIYATLFNMQNVYVFLGGTNGVNNFSSKLNFNVYPNPANIIVNISNIPGGSVLSIVDMMGRVIYHSVELNSTETIHTSDFKNGIYFIRLENNDKSEHKKLIISR